MHRTTRVGNFAQSDRAADNMIRTRNPRLLIIEDNETFVFGLRLNLEHEGFAVEACLTATGGLASLARERPDLVILDLLLPDMHGLNVLGAMRERGYEGPIVILSALGDESDRVAAFRHGASDYVTKPFGLLELVERIKARLRESGANDFDDGLSVDADAGRAYVGPTELQLTPKEFGLLRALLLSRGNVCSKADLLRDVWGITNVINTRTVDQHFRQLVCKLTAHGFKGKMRVVPKRGFILD